MRARRRRQTGSNLLRSALDGIDRGGGVRDRLDRAADALERAGESRSLVAAAYRLGRSVARLQPASAIRFQPLQPAKRSRR
jgi:hypothetical protein